MTLDFLENGIIRPQCEDPRVHFVLVCGAVGCPPIINEAYRPEKLEEQLNRQTMKALSDPGFVQLENNSRKAGLSKIFDWYTEDFGADKSTSLINYINQYRVEKIPNDYKVSFYPYDWTLNDSNAAIVNGGQANSPKTKKAGPGNNRFIVSALYDRGEYELNLFNNYFTQERPGPGTQRERVNFFSPLFQFLVGINKRVNVGFDLRFRSVNLALVDESAVFEALRFRNDGFETTDSFTGYSRTGFSAIGPKLKWQPFRAKSNITIQHTLYFPMFGSEDLEGNSENGYLDWDTPSMINQIFYDQPIGRKLGFFAEVDFNIDNMGDAINKNEFDYYQISTPLTTILSYFPKDEITIYGLLGYAPQWGYFVDVPEPDQTEVVSSYIPFNQLGLGFKYLLKNGLQFEVLVVDFNGAQEDSRSATYNFGVRYIGRK